MVVLSIQSVIEIYAITKEKQAKEERAIDHSSLRNLNQLRS